MKKYFYLKKYGLFLFASLLLSCGDTYEKVPAKQKLKVVPTLAALPKTGKAPKNNQPSKEKEKLGQLLFFDPILSGNKDVACATCHHPNNGYAEFLDLSLGVNAKGFGSKRAFNSPNDIPLVKRNAQTILNTAFNGIDAHGRYTPDQAPMFWDVRAKGLEKQALEPIKAFEEMRGHDFDETEILHEVVRRLQGITEYKGLFAAAFKEENPVTIENLAKAIAVFERSLVTNNTRFDQYMRGDEKAMLASEKEGLKLFKSVGCVNCHNGAMFSDYKVHVLGVPENKKLTVADKGVRESFGFRTPSLRNLRFTAPYMHNGSLKNLKQVLEFYEDIADGSERNKNVSKKQFDPLVSELKLSVKEMALIISFLNTLNDDSFDKTIPETVPSGLPVGGLIQ